MKKKENKIQTTIDLVLIILAPMSWMMLGDYGVISFKKLSIDIAVSGWVCYFLSEVSSASRSKTCTITFMGIVTALQIEHFLYDPNWICGFFCLSSSISVLYMFLYERIWRKKEN